MIGVVGGENNPVSIITKLSKFEKHFSLIRKIKSACRLVKDNKRRVLN